MNLLPHQCHRSVSMSGKRCKGTHLNFILFVCATLSQLLLDHGAQVNLRDCGGFTALHRACQKSFAHVAETLLRLGRANPQIKCPFSGNTALHEAAMLGHADCVNCLLEFHAAPWARNAELEMPFELALRFGFAELANALAGYQPVPPLTSQVNSYLLPLTK